MEEADLFMECEEEELEPWQQMNQNEPHDSPGPAERSPSPPPSVPKPVVVSSISSACTNVNPVPLLTNPLPTALPAGISKGTSGQQLILTQGARGLTPMALSQVILPGTSPAGSAGSSQPIYLTTQGIPVQNIQSGQSPLSIVLNVQHGQTVRPITLVQAPGTPGLFKPAVGTTQIITPPPQIRPTTAVVNRGQAPGSFTTMQIPATLTIRNAAPASQPRATSVQTSQLSTQANPLPFNTQTKIVTVKPGGSNLDMQNLMNIMNSVYIPSGNQHQTIVVMSNQKANGSGSSSAAVQTALPVAQANVVQGTSVSTLPYLCPRCGAQFKMLEALQGHMCFCCPDVTHTSVKSEVPTQVEQKQNKLTKIKTERTRSPGLEHQSRIVMLVNDFYYGTYEGNRGYVPTDNLKEALSFRCFTCGKKQKNNIRLMNHMKCHTQQSIEHVSCPHCYRQFPTPFRLQCHVESVHCTLESTTRCKICEWAFESEPVFLQHMKNTHKPGEMPYVCQLCQYRSSFYSDVHNHFCTWHEDTRYLLCIYCLKVFKTSGTYQQHFARHQKSSVYHCNKCRLQFLFTKEKVDHKVNHHKTFRKPAPLEGLQAGTKVTIRAYAGHKRFTGLTGPKSCKDTLVPQSSGPAKKQITKMYGYLTKFQEYRALLGRQKCVECTFDIPDFANHYPTYVHCSLCTYSTCCSRAYANHMINNHVSSRCPKARSKKESMSWLKLTCVWCNYKTTQGDLMAKHLAQFPDHSSCVFSLKECLETDIEFCQVEEEEEEEVEGANDEEKPDWLSMENWSIPSDGGSVPEFTESSGPQHSMAKSSDVLEYFQLLFPDSLIEQIAKETNAYAEYQRYVGKGDPTWQSLSSEEVKGFIGLSILMGLQVLPESEMYWSWEHYHSCSTFYRTMSAARFKQISQHIRMNSMLAKEKHDKEDKLSLFRPMLKILETSMSEAYKPNKCLTIDRTLLGSHENAANGEKSRNSQPRIWLLCDSKSGYCHKLLILTKQKKNGDLGSLVVPYLVKGLEGKHHQIFISSLLTSIPLMKDLYKQNIYCSSSSPTCGTVLPTDFWDLPALKNTGDYVQFEHPPVLVTRWKDAKEMVCISTNAVAGLPDKVWRRSTSKAGELSTISRPLAFKLLQDNMRGVDICSQLLACNQLGGLVLDTNWRHLFWFLVNLSIINSFIVLRETRKGNPPGWLHGGHFSQANYRKRLGYQLAKLAERQALQKEMSSDQLHQRRREGNPNIGFVEPKREPTPPVEDTTTPKNFTFGAANEDSYGMNEDIDQELAPLGSSDSELETDDSSQQEPLEIRDGHKGKESSVKPNSPKPFKETEDMMSARQLRILLFALCSGIRKAAKDMDTDPQLIRTWLQDKEKRLNCESLASSSGDAVEHLVEWVLVQREQQHPIREENLFQKASEIHSQTNQSNSFRISYEWAVTFMLQHKLGMHSLGTPGHQLPRRMEENCRDFTEFVHRQIKIHNVSLSAVGAMDELSIFVDFDRLVNSTGASKDSAFRLEGTGKPWMNIYLSVLADGTVLPTMLFIKSTPLDSFSKGLSDLVKLEARVEGFSEKEELEIWTANVWQQYLNTQNGNKAMLVIDGHYSHMTEDFLSILGTTHTLPLVIPPGCSSQRQPLEMCVRPVLKKFLLCRWSYFANQNKIADVKPEDLVRLLMSWLEEALTFCSGKPEMIQHSFGLSSLIKEHEECKKDPDAQLKLMNTLTEAILEPGEIDYDSQSQEKLMEKCVEGIMEKKENIIGENKSSIQQADREVLEETGDDSVTKTEKTAQASSEGLEASSEAVDLLPDNIPRIIESEGLSEPCQDLDTTQMDTGSNC
ncbi:pogo transposable element with ZNF domain isoform X1 [Clarias gariepinus]|uniref:pogo transposable element with ZNF domain isoform X1 n=1 Tax=Clarias gariepinus TaxID=13013 RepID=UPI00234C1B83|nr:pogo transposable element with ZNF domain isoform X1 [Clarias gariepinus]XP_053350788.1 pogo transposable element with ZNF domain isoform X1 [Clarias gariepinus]